MESSHVINKQSENRGEFSVGPPSTDQSLCRSVCACIQVSSLESSDQLSNNTINS